MFFLDHSNLLLRVSRQGSGYQSLPIWVAHDCNLSDKVFLCFIDRPVTFLYNTLHYYEHCLRDKPALKKKLVGAIIGKFACKRKTWNHNFLNQNTLCAGNSLSDPQMSFNSWK